MALKKIVIHKGFEVEYWKVIELIYCARRGMARVVVAMYKDEITRRENFENYAEALSFDVPINDTGLSDVYGELKKLTFFEGAEDVYSTN